MSFRYTLILLLVLALTWFLSVTNGFAEESVLICGEPWPPLLYETEGGNQESKEVSGLHLENFRLLSEATGLEFKFSILPWKRCMVNVENYSKPGDYEIAIDASFNTERAKKYLYVGPLYSISTAVFYSTNRFPDGPLSKKTGKLISLINEMKDYSICGLLGHNYEMYYVEHGIPRSNQIIRSPGGYQGMFSMLSKGRCDLVETHPLNVLGVITTGELKMPSDIKCSKMKEEPEAFYMMVSRKSPRAEELVTRLSTALIYLKRTLQWKSINTEGVLPVSETTDALKKCL